MKTRWIVLCEADNVATALAELDPGERIPAAAGDIALREPVSFGHKFALAHIPRGGEVIKYGETIGAASADIAAGDHVHTHNLAGQRGRGDLA